jgi:hypothetical protein
MNRKEIFQALLNKETLIWTSENLVTYPREVMYDENFDQFFITNNGILIERADGLYIRDPANWSVKPRTLTLGNVEYPAPEEKLLLIGEGYYVASLTIKEVSYHTWTNNSEDMYFLENGLVQKTQEGAKLQHQAILSVVGGIE